MVTIFNKMAEIDDIYQQNEGNLHYILNNYEITDEDFEYLTNLKEYNNG